MNSALLLLDTALGFFSLTETTSVARRFLFPLYEFYSAQEYPPLRVIVARGFHPFPSRTRPLSLAAPMVLHAQVCGRVGRRPIKTTKTPGLGLKPTPGVFLSYPRKPNSIGLTDKPKYQVTRFLHLFATFLILAPLFIGGASSLPQPKRDEKPPVPYLNPDGSVPSNFQNHKVLLDPVSGNAVVIFDSDANSNQKNSKMIAVELARHIDPKVEVMVDYDPDSRLWHYVYTFENGSSARQAVVSWYFKGLTDKTVSSIEVPEEWHYLFPSVLGSPNWPRLVIAATWGPGKTTLTIGVKPGGRIHDFEFKSVRAPALADIYAQGGAHFASFPAEPPQELQKVWGFPYNFRKTQTLIPAVDSSVTIQQLSAQYIE